MQSKWIPLLLLWGSITSCAYPVIVKPDLWDKPLLPSAQVVQLKDGQPGIGIDRVDALKMGNYMDHTQHVKESY
jgi:hypothetical protein